MSFERNKHVTVDVSLLGIMSDMGTYVEYIFLIFQVFRTPNSTSIRLLR